MKAIHQLAALAACIAVALPSCESVNDRLPPHPSGPSIPPPGTGSASGGPVSIKLLAPGGPIVIDPSQFDAVRRIAAAENQRQQLLATMEKEGRLLDTITDPRGERRELDKTIREGRKLNQGIDLTLRITNSGAKPVAIRYGPDRSANTLRIDGPAAVYVPNHDPITAELRIPPLTVLAPGASRDFLIRELRSGGRELNRWLIGAPGIYTARIQFNGQVTEDTSSSPDLKPGRFPNPDDGTRIDLTSNEVTFEVKAARP